MPRMLMEPMKSVSSGPEGGWAGIQLSSEENKRSAIHRVLFRLAKRVSVLSTFLGRCEDGLAAIFGVNELQGGRKEGGDKGGGCTDRQADRRQYLKSYRGWFERLTSDVNICMRSESKETPRIPLLRYLERLESCVYVCLGFLTSTRALRCEMRNTSERTAIRARIAVAARRNTPRVSTKASIYINMCCEADKIYTYACYAWECATQRALYHAKTKTRESYVISEDARSRGITVVWVYFTKRVLGLTCRYELSASALMPSDINKTQIIFRKASRMTLAGETCETLSQNL